MFDMSTQTNIVDITVPTGPDSLALARDELRLEPGQVALPIVGKKAGLLTTYDFIVGASPEICRMRLERLRDNDE